jgi:lipopolysaccharide/colanic/teichoic acid biosynthesis glycosyltransferase
LYVEDLQQDYAEVLTVRPGITDPTSLKFRDEATLLGDSGDPDALYRCYILPEKVKLSKEYVRGSSLGTDVALIFKTLATLVRPFLSRRS